MKINDIIIVNIEKELNILNIYPKTDKKIIALPIRIEHTIIATLGIY